MHTGSSQEVKKLAATLVAQRMWWLMFVCVLPIGIPSCGLGVVSTISVFVYDHWWQKILSLLGGLLGFGAPLWIFFGLRWLHRFPARAMLERAIALEKQATEQCLQLLGHPAYYNASVGLSGGALAVDPVSAKVAVVFGVMLPGKAVKTRAILLDATELRQWQAIDPGATSMVVGRGKTADQLMRIHNHNTQADSNRALGTGLHLVTDKLDATEILLNFDFETAKQWVILLNKLGEGRLETPGNSAEYPFQ